VKRKLEKGSKGSRSKGQLAGSKKKTEEELASSKGERRSTHWPGGRAGRAVPLATMLREERRVGRVGEREGGRGGERRMWVEKNRARTKVDREMRGQADGEFEARAAARSSHIAFLLPTAEEVCEVKRSSGNSLRYFLPRRCGKSTGTKRFRVEG